MTRRTDLLQQLIASNKFGKEKEPGILRMQADTVMLNPGSTSENKVALIYSRVGRALPLH